MLYKYAQSQDFSVRLDLMKKADWLDNFSRNLKKERKRLGLSQQKLAEKAKLSLTTVTRVEQGIMENPTLDTIEAIGTALKKSDPLDLLRK